MEIGGEPKYLVYKYQVLLGGKSRDKRGISKISVGKDASS